MNSKSVLNRIATLLSLDTKEVLFTDAKTADGTILQSPTFDLGETVEVVSEDGTKTPAPDGEHEIALKDSEGNEVLIKIETKDGVITERENVELPTEEAEKEVEEMEAETKEAHALPNTTDEDPRNSLGEDTDDKKDPIIALSYRIDEMEAKLKDMMDKFTSAFPSEGAEVSSLEPTPTMMEEVDEEELPKLDGAPREEVSKFSANKNNYGKKVQDSQSNFLSKLYN
jgi:hypothetical protein